MTIWPTRSWSESEPSVLSTQRCCAAVSGLDASNAGTGVADAVAGAGDDAERNVAQAAAPQMASERMIRSFMSGRISFGAPKLYRLSWKEAYRSAQRVADDRRTMVHVSPTGGSARRRRRGRAARPCR